jgi:hypothetical protein
MVRGADATTVRWSDEFLGGLVTSALLRYLALPTTAAAAARLEEERYPPFWKDEVAAVVEPTARPALSSGVGALPDAT